MLYPKSTESDSEKLAWHDQDWFFYFTAFVVPPLFLLGIIVSKRNIPSVIKNAAFIMFVMFFLWLTYFVYFKL